MAKDDGVRESEPPTWDELDRLVREQGTDMAGDDAWMHRNDDEPEECWNCGHPLADCDCDEDWPEGDGVLRATATPVWTWRDRVLRAVERFLFRLPF